MTTTHGAAGRIEGEGDDSAAILDELEPLLTVVEVASYLQVPVKTLYTWRYQREGPPGLRVGRHVRYRRTDVEAWVEQRIANAAGGPIG